MTPVVQRVLNDQGDCFQACVASILECPLEDVPYNPTLGETVWFEQINDWLRPTFGLEMVHWSQGDNPELSWKPRGWAIASVRIAGQEELHAMVALDGRFVFNPTPGAPIEGGSLRDVLGWTIFQLLDPSRRVNR